MTRGSEYPLLPSDLTAFAERCRDWVEAEIGAQLQQQGLRLRRDPVFTEPYNSQRADHHLGVAAEIKRGVYRAIYEQ
jgi:hypothetical protein